MAASNALRVGLDQRCRIDSRDFMAAELTTRADGKDGLPMEVESWELIWRCRQESMVGISW